MATQTKAPKPVPTVTPQGVATSETKPTTPDIGTPYPFTLPSKPDKKVVFHIRDQDFVVPMPASPTQERIDMRTVARHDHQPRDINGSEHVTSMDKLVYGYNGRRVGLDFTSDVIDKVVDGKIVAETVALFPKIGQDENLPKPLIFRHKGKLTAGKGHCRRGFVLRSHIDSPAWAEKAFPGHTLLCDVLEMDPNSPQAIGLIEDHDQRDDRTKLFAIEEFDRFEKREQMYLARGYTKDQTRTALISGAEGLPGLGREAVDKLPQWRYLPPSLMEHARREMALNHRDLVRGSIRAELYRLAQDHATRKEHDSRCYLFRRMAEANGTPEADIVEGLKSFEPLKGRAKPRPDPTDPGEKYLAAVEELLNSKSITVVRSLSTQQVDVLISIVKDRSTKPEVFDMLAALLIAIGKGDPKAAASCVRIVQGALERA